MSSRTTGSTPETDIQLPAAHSGRPNIGLHYDLRRHVTDMETTEWRHAASLEQMVLAEQVGFESVWINEHHFSSDEQTTSPLLIASALAGSTRRIRIGTNILILPLYHPIKLAEEAATVALLSNGRFILGVGAGYYERDFATFGQQLSQRPSLMSEGVEILRKSWSGASFRHQGRRWDFPELAVNPIPSSQIPIFVGGFAPAAIERAAAIGDGFMAGSPESIPVYLDAIERSGGSVVDACVSMNVWALIAPDPEEVWAQVGPHALTQMNDYVRNGGYGDAPLFADEADVLARGQYVLWDGPTAVKRFRELFAQYPQLVDVQLFSRMPGESFESSSARMEYIAREVLPHI